MKPELAAVQASQHFLSKMGHKHGLAKSALATADLKNVHNLGRGAVVARYQQKVNGLEVVGRQLSVVMNQQMELVATTGHFHPGSASHQSVANQFKIDATDALRKAVSDLGANTKQLKQTGEKGGYQVFQGKTDKYNFLQDPRVKKVYYPGPKKLMAAYVVEVMAGDPKERKQHAYRYVISAHNGNILQRLNLTNYEAYNYRVMADATAPFLPYDGPTGASFSPHPTGMYRDKLVESQVEMNLNAIESIREGGDPWLPEGATETNGNNVDAYGDLDQEMYDNFFNEETDIRAGVTSANTFDYSYNYVEHPLAETQMRSAIVNLFYVINHLHDTYYDHGFTEATGNAQHDNYGRGGIDGDKLQGQAMDLESFNNANMATPADGGSPVMQMYLWTGESGNVTVGDQKGLGARVSSGWGPQEFDVSGTVVRYEGPDGSTACEAATNADALAGKIAIVDRGGCNFTAKAFNAQSAGAIGTIVANNDTDNPDRAIAMGGEDDGSITTPALMISYNNGVKVYDEIKAGRDSGQIIGSGSGLRDGSVDNAIVAHEWGHYITHRLTEGGLYLNNQGGAMGEGWGDFFALMMTVRDGDQSGFNNSEWGGLYTVGAYALSGGNTDHAYYWGIRRVPYSTDTNYNALTFKHIESGVPLPDNHPVAYEHDGAVNSRVHSSGEIWATALWESYAALLNREDLSFSQAQSKMRDYVVAGLMITPSSPTYIEARDAILAAALADNVDNYNTIRAAFAKRGMGINAVAPHRDSEDHAGVVEDFNATGSNVELISTSFDTAYTGESGGFCDNDSVLDVRETAAFKFSLRNSGTTEIAGLKAKVTVVTEDSDEPSNLDIELANDGMVEFTGLNGWNDTTTGVVEVKLNGANTNQAVTFNIEFMSEDESLSLPHAMQTTVNVHRDLAKTDTRTVEDFETAYLSDSDWSRYKTGTGAGGHFLEDWTVVPEDYMWEGATSTMMGPNRGVEGDMQLMTPTVTVGESGDFVFSFSHFYYMEASEYVGDYVHWDGGVIEVSVDGGEWQDVVDAGGVFLQGYNGMITEGDGENYGPNPILGGRNGFVDIIPTFDISPESITFADGSLNGKEVQFRFRLGSDGSVAQWGWNIDNVAFTNTASAAWSDVVADADMCNPPPTVTAAQSSVNVDERESVTLTVTGSDIDDEALTYTWLVDGVDVGNNATSYVYEAPRVTQDSTTNIQVIAHDGRNPSEPANITVNINNSKSGGSWGLVSLLLAPLVFIRRRKVK
jgi:Zn-dependent metalloprotease